MSTEAPMAHRPDACPDPEQLAAYIDDKLPPDERTQVEEHLADCPDCLEILGGSAESLEEIRTAVERAQPIRPDSDPPKVVSLAEWLRSRPLLVAGGAFATAAAVALVVWLQQPSPYYVPEMKQLVSLEMRTRPTEARLTGGFRYAPPPVVTRGTGASRSQEIAATAEKARAEIASRSGPEADAARGITFILDGDPAAAVLALERAAGSPTPSARMLSDLAAAYLERNLPGDLRLAELSAQRALVLAPESLEARFNLALALERSAQMPAALQAWQEFERREHDSNWGLEARRHIARLSGS